MFGGEAIGVIALLLLAFFASIALALALGLIALLLLRKKKNRAAAYVSLPILYLLLSWTGVYLYFSPRTEKSYIILASVVLAMALGVAALILFRKKEKRAAAYVSLPILFLLLTWTGLYLHFTPPGKKTYTISFAADPSAKFRGFPAGPVVNVRPGVTEHQIWGFLTVEIKLPDGKSVRGASDGLSLIDTTNGLAWFTLNYTPGSGQDDQFQYWTEGGKLNETSVPGKRIQVDRQGYSLDLCALAPAQGGYLLEVRFPSFNLVQPAGYSEIPRVTQLPRRPALNQ